jgi:hypothetical protein
MSGGLFLWLQKTQRVSQREVMGRMFPSLAESSISR